MALEQILNVTFADHYTVPPRVYMVKTDSARVLTVVSEDYTIPSGATATLKIKRSNGTYWTIDSISAPSGNRISFDASQMLTEVGITEAMLQLVSDEKVLKSFVFLVDVQPSSAGEPETEEQGKTFEQYVSEAESARDEAVTASESAQEAAEQISTAIETAITPIENRLAKVESVNARQQIEIDLNTAFRKDKYSIEVEDSSVAYAKDVPEGALPWAEVKMVGGKSVVMNQLFDYTKFPPTSEVNGITFTNNGDGTITVNGTATADAFINLQTVKGEYAGKTFFLKGCPYSPVTTDCELRSYAMGTDIRDKGTGNIDISTIGSNSRLFRIYVYSGASVNNLVFTPQLFDLTKYDSSRNWTLEMAKAEFPNAYYPYNEGSIISANLSEIESRGANLLDLSDVYGKEIASSGIGGTIGNSELKADMDYYITPYSSNGTNQQVNTYIQFTTTAGNVIHSCSNPFRLTQDQVDGFQSVRYYASTSYTVKAIMVANNDNAVFKPYRGTIGSIAFPSAIASQMHGINSDVYDEVELVPRTYANMKSVDLGTLNWNGSPDMWSVETDKDFVNGGNCLTTNGYTNSGYLSTTQMKEKQIQIRNNGYIFIKDSSYSNASEFKQALSGVILHYESVSGGTDYEAVVMEKKCGVVDLASLTFNNTWGRNDCFVSIGVLNDAKTYTSEGQTPNILCSTANATNITSLFAGGNGVTIRNDKKIYYDMDSTEAPTGILIYELATPQILDVTEYFPDENYRFLEVEGGGSITFKQTGDFKLAIPSVVEYDVKVGE